MKEKWYTQTEKEIFTNLKTTEYGLTSQEAENRFAEFGPNRLPESRSEGFFIIFLRQFQSSLIYMLLGASIIVYFTGEHMDAIIILCVLLFNALTGAIQEGRAQRTLLILKKYVESNATVLRDGRETILPHNKLVPGDIIILREGDKVTADARVLSSNSLQIDESALTGESGPIYKQPGIITSNNIALGDQTNMVFKGTGVTAGNGKALVVQTGARTIIGKITKQLATIDSDIPLKKDIKNLSNTIIIVVAILGSVLFALGLARGIPLKDTFATVVATAVSIIPEGLPIVITLVLATGVWRMNKQHVLIKRLQAVEALGQATIIAVDKTGTITRNELVVQKLYVANTYFDITGNGYQPSGDVFLKGKAIDAVNHPELMFASKLSMLSANARLLFSPSQNSWEISGDPTEAAMIVFGEKMGHKKEQLESETPRVDEIPFDYKTKLHLSLYKENHNYKLVASGEPERLLNISTSLWHPQKNIPLTATTRNKIAAQMTQLSEKGLRLIAIAYADTSTMHIIPEKLPKLIFVGFLSMQDALREEVREATKRTTEAGLKVVMITGDNELTAQTIATQAGIFQQGDTMMNGRTLDRLTPQQLSQKIDHVSVFARVNPEHKLKIIQAYKMRGEIIAMTGDGVNDALSLTAADLGVAMGKIGTQVAKEAADIILMDDNFGSIVSGIEEGRNIYKTIKKVLLYLFSTSIGEVFMIMIAISLGLPLPILPVQILWLNLITDGPLDFALAMEPKEKAQKETRLSMRGASLVDWLMVKRITTMAFPMIIGSLALYYVYVQTDQEKAWTISLTTLSVFQWFNALNCRSETKSIFQINPFSNKYLLGGLGLALALQLVAIYNPIAQQILKTVPLSWEDWKLILLVSTSIIATEEIRKLIVRVGSKRKINK